jgi:ABC-type Fe3+ transport system permease subunit
VSNVEEFSEQNNWAYVLFTSVNGFSLFLLTCSVMVYGRILAKRFIVEPNRSQSKSETRRKYQSLLRINTILGICCVCFFLRVVCLGIAISDSFGTNIEEKYFPPIWWFLLNSWIPTVPVSEEPSSVSLSLCSLGLTLSNSLVLFACFLSS